MSQFIRDIVYAQKAGYHAGIVSSCTANRYAIKASLMRAKQYHVPALIEATANQVDQLGGYTGMRPADFVRFVHGIASEIGLAKDQVILGGDHLGPLTKADRPEEEAMAFAKVLVADYVRAGFTKIHLDTSMRLADDDPLAPLDIEKIAHRGAALAQVAEQAYNDMCEIYPETEVPLYVIGSEVPIPGGAREHEESINITTPDDCLETYAAYEMAFAKAGLEDAFSRIIGMVVQPGVEFGTNEVFIYYPEAASELIEAGRELPIVFEGHSTDYQTRESLRHLIHDGVAILKVGPALTFALREALFAFENIDREVHYGMTNHCSGFREILELVMTSDVEHWKKYYQGTLAEQHYARSFSFSDRARYYLPHRDVKAAMQQLLSNISETDIPLTIISQYLPKVYPAVLKGQVSTNGEALLLEHIGTLLDDYYFATKGTLDAIEQSKKSSL